MKAGSLGRLIAPPVPHQLHHGVREFDASLGGPLAGACRSVHPLNGMVHASDGAVHMADGARHVAVGQADEDRQPEHSNREKRQDEGLRVHWRI